MKVTAFIRPNSMTVGKNNVSSQTHVYFRVRDVGVDIKAVSELSINPNHWSAERQAACRWCQKKSRMPLTRTYNPFSTLSQNSTTVAQTVIG